MRDHREAAKAIDIFEHFSGIVGETNVGSGTPRPSTWPERVGDFCADDDENAVRVALSRLEVEIVMVCDDHEVEARPLCCSHYLVHVTDAIRVNTVYM